MPGKPGNWATTSSSLNGRDLILIAGENEGSLCYVCSGLVKVYKTSPEGKEQVLRLIGAGNTFNDVPALDGGPIPANVAAVESSNIPKYTDSSHCPSHSKDTALPRKLADL